MTILGCYEEYHNDTGIMTSPNFPANYPNNVNCTFTIQTNNTRGIEITFQYFNLEYNYDYLYVGTGEYNIGGESQIIGAFTGDRFLEFSR